MIKDYIKVCKRLAQEMYDYGIGKDINLNETPYIVGKDLVWSTNDGSCGGINISWAVGVYPEDVEKLAPKHFLQHLRDEMQIVLEEVLDENDEPENERLETASKFIANWAWYLNGIC